MKIKAEMAGTVLEVKVKAGDRVTSGQEIAILESMKMEVPLLSPANGKIDAVLKKTGEFVNEGEGIFEISS
jgi:acetyl-CoA carboxylase biotin carboxyl carrier protein